jgi:hypothetical protein
VGCHIRPPPRRLLAGRVPPPTVEPSQRQLQALLSGLLSARRGPWLPSPSGACRCQPTPGEARQCPHEAHQTHPAAAHLATHQGDRETQAREEGAPGNTGHQGHDRQTRGKRSGEARPACSGRRGTSRPWAA